jgi:hypothetical protein
VKIVIENADVYLQEFRGFQVNDQVWSCVSDAVLRRVGPRVGRQVRDHVGQKVLEERIEGPWR